MIAIRTNRTEYRNDIAEEIRLFLGLAEITLYEEINPADAELVFTLMLEKYGRRYQLSADAGDYVETDAFELPDQADALTTKKLEKRALKLACYRLLKRLYPRIATPWGSLTGIRPTKLYRELMLEGGESHARTMFRDTFDVSEEKTALAARICGVQEPMIRSVMPREIDLYVGIPFCRTKCLYCSFPSEVMGRNDRLPRYLDALKSDIAAGAALVRENDFRVRSFYMGGGTPTVLSAAQLEDLLGFTLKQYGTFGMESTVEAGRPDTIDREKLLVLKGLGVSRISINPQTMSDETLRRVGRSHTAADIVQVYRLAREIGFDSINMDLIAGLPGEITEDMQRSCDAIADLRPDNLTVHSLAIKRSSLLKKELDEYPLASAEQAEEMTRIGARCAERMGMQPYYMYRQKYMSGNLENVGYALPGKECVYNIDMMEETASILSHGAGTMTKRVFGGENRIERLPSPKDVPTYLEKLERLADDKRAFFTEKETQKNALRGGGND
ncbi:Oxygen-independent coproporphyrinogen-III oxidase-like protein HemZ [bioreactor metagenome]|uniref:Oxygen-independent coproporphyrinogen-III oxidase-like protein HemZ n=1 Tax=bioreactor metagenome TaxID=1076179 RepID=A0A645AJM5_9ZZZZ|nr:coproporphyrinogen dehydrogenase HemZ [Christensenella sp.]